MGWKQTKRGKNGETTSLVKRQRRKIPDKWRTTGEVTPPTGEKAKKEGRLRPRFTAVGMQRE
jgi:hypothetical protein